MVSLLAQAPKGKGFGKGKATTKGTRSGVPSTVSESSTSTPSSNTWSPAGTNGALGTSPSSFKGKGKQKGKFTKGKSSRPPNSGASSQLICNLCHLHGHTERNYRKKNALHHSNPYQQARSQFNNRQQLVMDQLENNLFAPMSALGAYNLTATQPLVILLKTLNFILKLPTCFSPPYYPMFKTLNLA
jgi:hypothetical protein